MNKASDWILNQPWAITEEALGVVMSIADRTNESPEAVEARLGRPLDNTRETTVRDGVAVVPVTGPVSRYANLFSRISGATDIETLARDFRAALDDRSVKAVVLSFDSPGGTVAGVAEFAQHVLEARGTKPVVAYVGAQACSAAYWIASAADAIVCDPTATLGSIGVVIGMRKAADDRPGQARTVEFVSSQSPHKRPDPETETGRAQIQATADDLGDVFVDAVALHRGVARDVVLSDFGRGGVLVGARAVAAGMADRVGSLEPLIAELARGECPARKPHAPARKGKNPKEPAMSEPTQTPVAGDQDHPEIQRLRAELAAAADRSARAEAANAELLEQAISARADAFVAEVVGDATATLHAADLRNAFVMAARDDHRDPMAVATARQDGLRAALKHRGTPTKEAVASDPSLRTRALASDPAAEDARPGADADAAREAAEREERRRRNHANAERHNRPAR